MCFLVFLQNFTRPEATDQSARFSAILETQGSTRKRKILERVHHRAFSSTGPLSKTTLPANHTPWQKSPCRLRSCSMPRSSSTPLHRPPFLLLRQFCLYHLGKRHYAFHNIFLIVVNLYSLFFTWCKMYTRGPKLHSGVAKNSNRFVPANRRHDLSEGTIRKQSFFSDATMSKK